MWCTRFQGTKFLLLLLNVPSRSSCFTGGAPLAVTLLASAHQLCPLNALLLTLMLHRRSKFRATHTVMLYQFWTLLGFTLRRAQLPEYRRIFVSFAQHATAAFGHLPPHRSCTRAFLFCCNRLQNNLLVGRRQRKRFLRGFQQNLLLQLHLLRTLNLYPGGRWSRSAALPSASNL